MSSAPKQPSIRPEVPADYDAIHSVVAAAFGRQSEAQLVRLLRADADVYVPELALIAEDGEEIVGHIMLTKALLHGDEDWQGLLLAPLAVTPERQRTGAGIALMEAALEIAATREEPFVVLLGHPAYYPRFGFERARDYGVEPPSPLVSDEAFMIKKLPKYEDHYRGKIAYAPAFDQV